MPFPTSDSVGPSTGPADDATTMTGGVTLTQIVEGSPVATFVIDRNHVVTHWNRACEQLTGKRRNRIVGTRRQWTAFYPEKRPVLADLIVDGGDPAVIARYYGTRFGSLDLIAGAYYAESFFPQFGPAGRWLYFTAAPLRDEEGGIVGAIETLQDFTAQRASEAALVQSEEKYRTLHENVPVGLFRVTADGEILSVNPALVKMLGADSEASLLGLTVPESPVGDEKGRELLDAIRRDGRLKGVELVMGRIGGGHFWSAISAITVRDPEGRPLYIDGIVEDITERKQAETDKMLLQEQLRQVQKMEAIGTLAGGIAHDFNNILGGIMGYAELLAEEIDPVQDQQRYYLAQIGKATERARDLVNQILAFSRQNQAEFRPIHAGSVVGEALRLLRATLPSNIKIVESITANAACILADATQIHQILMNLGTNAYQAMRPAGGVLSVALSRVDFNAPIRGRFCRLDPGAYVRLSVTDTGPGIDGAHLDRIFDPYFTTKERGEGTGLGLSVTLGIVKNHGGGISVESRPGTGAGFHVFLPVIDTARTQPECADPMPPGGVERILFVDDEAFYRDIVRRQLESLGYRVQAESGAGAALERLRNRSEHFDLVITDQTMPDMTGVELAEAAKAIRPDLPVILCTGFSETVDEETAPAFGISKFVMKPVSRNQLARAIRDVLDP